MAITYDKRTISDFKSRLSGGGARPNLFEVVLGMPTWATKGFGAGGIGGASAGGNGPLAEEARFMIKAAELPASNVGDIPVNFRGRILHVAGDRTFDPWTVTIINNNDWSLRKTMEDWSNVINNRVWDSGVTNPTSYHADAEVFQLARGGAKSNTSGNVARAGTDQQPVVAAYKFFGIWPSQVSSIALDYGSTDTIEEFQVTFQVEYWGADYATDKTEGGKYTTAANG